MSLSKPILISGSGLGGLLLARSLHKYHIPFEIYERDSAGASRSQGYRIRISKQGLNALEAVLSPAQYQKFRDGATNNGPGKMTSYDPRTMEKIQLPGKGNTGPREGGEVLGVDRAFLRNQLFEGIENLVHFNKNITGYELTANGVKARFSDGTTSVEGCMLVGADGVRSKITPQLTNGQLKVYDTGARMIHGSSPKSTFAGLTKGEFGAFALRDMSHEKGKISMITNVRDEVGDDVHFGWVLVGGPGTLSAPNDDFSVSGQPAVDICLDLTSEWSEIIRPILTEQNVKEAAFLKMATSAPEGVPDWKNESRVTLMGDAVHAMTPAGGVGANTALRDAELLGRLIAERGGWDENVTSEYEKEMRVYATQNVQDSWEEASKMLDIKELHTTI